MVLPIVIIGIIAVVGAVLVFSPAGDLIQDVLQQSGLTDPEAFEIIDQESELELEEDIVGGFEGFIHEMITVGQGMGNDSIDASDFEGNPIGMTEAEARDINNKGVNFFTAFAELFFTGHAFIVSVINGLSPVELGIAIVSIIALLVSIMMIMGHAKNMGKHWAIIVMVVSFVILFMIVVGGQASI